MQYETDMETYLRLKQCLSEIYPQVEVTLLKSDPMLKKLGFVETVPCKIELNITKAQRDKIRDMVLQFEINAFNTIDGKYPPENSMEYKNYYKYGWIFDFL
ncbi:MAG: hypothetical protein Q8882_05065 [Bacillota bacterium]|nr:hypothetical protein [Bacillota bacterium]